MAKEKSEKIITLSHGSGGEQMRELIADLILPRFDSEILSRLGDSAVLDFSGCERIAFATDSYVIDPVFFPGGDIGYLSVCGTVNDLAVSGSLPRYISAGLIIEEGFEISQLEKILDSMARAAREAGVKLVTGDTKVVARGAADKIFINTAGLGVMRRSLELSPANCGPGDEIIVSGPVGTHGASVLLAREDFALEADLQSDVAPLGDKIESLIEATPEVRMMRDPTRGGLAGVLNELVSGSGLGIELEEARIPVLESVRGVCEILGFDPLILANEGIFVTVVPSVDTTHALEALQSAGAVRAACVGRMVEDEAKMVTLNTLVGGQRVVTPPAGELLPRIC